MKPPTNTRPNQSSSDKTKIIGVIIFLAILLLVFGILLGQLLRRSGFQFSLPVSQATATFQPISITQEPTLVNPSQLDMLFVKSSVSADQTSITLDIKLTNKGVNPITLTDNDISIVPENGTASPPTAVTPTLPQEIPPGASVIISVTFPYFNTPSVVLKILDLTLNYSLQ